MAISFVNQAQTGTATVTLPTGIKLNDVIVLIGYRNTTTAPSLPTGYTAISSVSANVNSARACFRQALGTESGTTVTMTNANVVICVVYRGCYAVGSGPGITSNAASTTTNLATTAMDKVDSTSWGVYYCGSKQTTSQSTPASTTIRGTTQTGTTSILGVFDTNAGVASLPAKTSTAGASATGAGGSFELIATRAAATLSDDFNDNSVDATKWDFGTAGAGSTAAETNQQTEQTPATSVAGAEGFLDGGGFTPKWDLTGGAFFVNLKQALNSGSDNFTELHVIPNDHNELTFSVRNTAPQQLLALDIVLDAETVLATTTYNATTHAWLRIREAGGTIFWDTSPDGKSWTNFTSLANPFSIQSLYPKLNAFTPIGNASPGKAIWDSFNLAPPIGLIVRPNQAINRAGTY